MTKNYRVILTTGETWVTTARDMTQARNLALHLCPSLQLFGVRIERIEQIGLRGA